VNKPSRFITSTGLLTCGEVTVTFRSGPEEELADLVISRCTDCEEEEPTSIFLTS